MGVTWLTCQLHVVDKPAAEPLNSAKLGESEAGWLVSDTHVEALAIGGAQLE